MIFLGSVSVICLPFALYRINNALYLAKIGIEIIVKNISVEHVLFGAKLKFEYVTSSDSSKLKIIITGYVRAVSATLKIFFNGK